jgi:hypothetical protein
VKEAADVSPKFISFIFLKIMIIKFASLGVLVRNHLRKQKHKSKIKKKRSIKSKNSMRSKNNKENHKIIKISAP